MKEIESHFRSTEITALEDIKVTTIDSFQVQSVSEQFWSIPEAGETFALSLLGTAINLWIENSSFLGF